MKIIRVESCAVCPYVKPNRWGNGEDEWDALCSVYYPPRMVTLHQSAERMPNWCPLEDEK